MKLNSNFTDSDWDSELNNKVIIPDFSYDGINVEENEFEDDGEGIYLEEPEELFEIAVDRKPEQYKNIEVQALSRSENVQPAEPSEKHHKKLIRIATVKRKK